MRYAEIRYTSLEKAKRREQNETVPLDFDL